MITKAKVKEWIDLSAQLKEIKEREAELRKEIAEYILEDKKKGAKQGKISIFTLKATGKLNRNIDKPLLQAIWSDLSKEEKQAIKFTPTVVEKEYKTLPADSKLHRCIEEKPGMPSLEIKKVDADPDDE